MTKSPDMTVRRRNAAIKKVLQRRFGDAAVSVRGSGVRGSNIQCRIAIDIPSDEEEDALPRELIHMIESAGIDLPYFAYVSDMTNEWHDVPSIRFSFWEGYRARHA
jgi:hypothetical protein